MAPRRSLSAESKVNGITIYQKQQVLTFLLTSSPQSSKEKLEKAAEEMRASTGGEIMQVKKQSHRPCTSPNKRPFFNLELYQEMCVTQRIWRMPSRKRLNCLDVWTT